MMNGRKNNIANKYFIGSVITIFAAIIYWMFLSWFQPEPKLELEWHTETNHGQVENGLILFIHGLGGDAQETWRASKDSSTWMEMFAKDKAFGKSVIVSVNYPTGILENHSMRTKIAGKISEYLTDEKQFKQYKNITIIAHSLGGLIARQALWKADLHNDASRFVTLITLGSPFKGCSVAELAALFPGINERQIKSLSPDHESLKILQDLWEKYVQKAGINLRQYAVFETKNVIVDKDSATQGITLLNTYPGHGLSHTALAKPHSPSDQLYEQVREWVLDSAGIRHYEAGKHNLKSVLHIAEGVLLKCDPGAKLIFSEDAYIDCEGKIIARGSQDKPIEFLFNGSERQDQAIIMRGRETQGSTFSFCNFQGGNGVRLEKADPNLKKSEEEYIEAINFGSGVPYGGGVILAGTDDVDFEHCKFLNNEAWMGGAVALLGAERTDFKDCTFEGNLSGYGGGAIFGQWSSFYTTGCTFEDNKTGENYDSWGNVDKESSKYACGGAIYTGTVSQIDIRGCTFKDNNAQNSGGAIYFLDTHLENPQKRASIISESYFEENVAKNDEKGRNVRIDDLSRVHITGVTIDGKKLQGKASRFGVNDQTSVNPTAKESRSLVEIKETDTDRSTFKNKREQDSKSEEDKSSSDSLNPQPGQEENLDQLEGSKDEEQKVSVIESLMENKDSYESLPTRDIDTIVIHHISAIFWEKDNFQRQFKDKIEEFEERPMIKDVADHQKLYKYDWRFCKKILDLYGVSAHYLIDRKGVIRQLVKENDIAYHAGRSVMPPPDGREGVNEFSIGIELISSHPEDDPLVRNGEIPAYTDAQYQSLTILIKELRKRYEIPLENIVGHDQIAGERAVQMGIRKKSSQKTDPGPAFDWSRLRKEILVETGSGSKNP